MENETKNTENTLRDEFRQLGENIRDAFQSAWASDERQRIQTDIHEGLREVGDSLNEAVNDFQASETGQKIRKEVDDFGEKIDSGELEQRIRTDLSKVLRAINTEISSFLDHEEEQTPFDDTAEE